VGVGYPTFKTKIVDSENFASVSKSSAQLGTCMKVLLPAIILD